MAETQITEAQADEALQNSAVIQAMDESFMMTYSSENFLTSRENTKVKLLFMEATASHFDAEASKRRAWIQYILFLADSGFSEVASNPSALTVTTRDDQGVVHYEYGESYDTITADILHALGHRYTHRRFANTNCELVRIILKKRGTLTNYGFKNHIPAEFLEFAFPGAEFCHGISDKARTALSFAKNYALRRVAEDGPPTIAADSERIQIFH